MAEFTVQGPFEVPVEKLPGGRRVLYNDFWKQSEVTLFSGERGVYLFAVSASGSFTPLYVGAATKTFKQEVFNPTNRHKYQDGLAEYKKGKPVMFFILHPKQKGPTNETEILQIEAFLIQLAVERNQNLQNIKGKKNAPKWSINGVIRSGQGRPDASAISFKRAMGIEHLVRSKK